MLKSMTGFGKATFENESISASVEIKSLNSKFTELGLRLPKHLSNKELDARNIINTELQRGKINVFIEFERKNKNILKSAINKDLLKQYYDQLKDAANYVKEENPNIFNVALHMPDVLLSGNENDSSDEDWGIIKKLILDAIAKTDKFRIDEGKKMQNALESYIKNISEMLNLIEKEEPLRKESYEKRIKSQLAELKEDYDKNRFEQELIYYLEKLDITEEKVRLKSHLEYFAQELKIEGSGKKLGFISQEIGREINTIGSKANYASIQKIVVQMKDDLEKIKEQLNNII